MSHLVELIQYYGLAFVFVNVLLLQAGLPVPAYPTLIITGALATRGGASVPALVAVAVVAALIADLAWYMAGRKFGSGVLKTICRISLSPDSCVRQTESIFARWGARSLAVAKFIPGFASVATSMAGVVRLPVWKFVLFDAIGAALWSGVAIGLGYAFSGAINQVLAVFETLGKIGLWLIAGAFVLYILAKWWQRELFIWQLRMDRVTVDELHELMTAQSRGQGHRRALADVAVADGPHSRRDHRRSQEHARGPAGGRARERGDRLLRVSQRIHGGQAREGADPARVQARASAAGRHRRVDRGGAPGGGRRRGGC